MKLARFQLTCFLLLIIAVVLVLHFGNVIAYSPAFLKEYSSKPEVLARMPSQEHNNIQQQLQTAIASSEAITELKASISSITSNLDQYNMLVKNGLMIQLIW